MFDYHCIEFQGKRMIQAPDPNSGRQMIFSKIWLHQSLDIMVSYHHIQYQKKTNDPILKKLVTNVRTEGQTDGRE